MRGDALAACRARLVQEQRAGAHAGHEATALRGLAQPLDHDRVVDLATRSLSARNQHHVEGRRSVEAVVRQHPQALGAAHGPLVLGEGDHRAGRALSVVAFEPQGSREDFPRAREVELLDAVEEQDADGVGHGGLLSSLL